ncbi:MAG: hypothetical protein KAT18_07490 [Candidatus Latescibacteria bacterium]|nr:hypothetical protein [Candidatus Latescibacterota bacterium]
MIPACQEFDETRLGPYLRANAIETEHQLAIIHVVIGILGCAVSVFLVWKDLLPLLVPGWFYLSGLFFFLVYATVYIIWAPYRKYSLWITAGVITLLDLSIATLIILNTGGLGSTFWGLWAAVALTYIIRFRFGWIEGIVTLLLLSGTFVLAGNMAAESDIPSHGAIVGVVFSLIAILSSGYILVSRERKAVRQGMMAECETIHRIVNTVQHEVNNPLTVASGNLQLLKAETTEETFMSRMDKIEEALARIGTAVEQLSELQEDHAITGEGLVERYPLREEQKSLGEE